MKRQQIAVAVWLVLTMAAALAAQRPAEVVRSEIRQAAKEAPTLADVLKLQPGMVVADVGAGGGAMTASFSKLLGPDGRVYATDVGPTQLAEIRELVSRERLENVTVIEGARNSTNLPDGCCDAIFMRDVYHHLTQPQDTNDSVFAALKPGGRLAIMDFEPAPGSTVPTGVPDNRGGHGIRPSLVVREVTASGFRHVDILSKWPPEDDRSTLFLVLFQRP